MDIVDLLIRNAAQIATCARPMSLPSTGSGSGVPSTDSPPPELVEGVGELVEPPRRGAAMQEVGLIEDGAVAIDDGLIVAVGDTGSVGSRYRAHQTIDASGKAICPGFVDPHTHTVYGGDRAHEFELRIKGASYMEIMAAGGGILSTMRHTREASLEDLVVSASKRLDEMLALGSTTVEIKTGYGLDLANEMKMLQVIARLDQTHPCDIVPTFLGAHTVPPEYRDDTEGYVELLIEEMIPAASDWYRGSHFAAKSTPFFIDVFCEDHAFDVPQSRRILQAGIEAGMRAKIHVDQFNSFGGLPMALELGAISADHLDVSGPQEIKLLAESDTVATPLPAVTLNLALDEYAAARAMIDAGAVVALATDINPGSAPCFSMPLVMAIACRFQKLLPSEALNASTVNAAHAIGLGRRLGSIEAGKQADLLILKEADYRHIAYFFGHNPVDMVIKRGRPVTGPNSAGLPFSAATP